MSFQILKKVIYNHDDARRMVSKHGDKLLLPERILHELVDMQKNKGIEKLPHPLVFRLSTPSDSTFIGVKEFHGEDDTSVFLTQDVKERLRINENVESVKLSIELALNVSGLEKVKEASIELKPIKSYSDIRDWKAFLESTLSKRYTAITMGDELYFDFNSKEYILKVVKVMTSNAMRTVCVVDRDIDLVILGDNRQEIIRDLFQDRHGHLEEDKVVKIQIKEGDIIESEGSFAVGDEFVSRNRFEWATMGDCAVYKSDAKKYLFAFESLDFKLISKEEAKSNDETKESVQCQYCKQMVSKISQVMHENFCQRNNIKCDECNAFFFKRIPETHWDCCGRSGNDQLSKFLHEEYLHKNVTCSCGIAFVNNYERCLHISLECPSGVHECRFCHLVLPRGELTTESRYHNVTSHEWECGSKTVKCYKCGKIVKIRDIQLHEEFHRLDTISNEPIGCTNVLCPNLRDNGNPLGLCIECFSPLYSNVHDPDGKKLASRMERRYILMMKNGCGDDECDNELCNTGDSMGDIVKRVKAMDSGLLQFCVDKKRREKMRMVTVFEGSEWSKGWVIRGLKECGWTINGVIPWLDSNVRGNNDKLNK